MRLFYLYLIFLFLLSAAGEDTRITFPYFTAEDDINFRLYGDAAHNTANRSYVINGGATHSRGSCGELLYRKMVRIQDVATRRVASFSTSFSFTFTTLGELRKYTRYSRESNGMAFTLMRSDYFATMQEFISEIGRTGPCRPYEYRSDPLQLYTPSSFTVVIGKDYNSPDNEPSNHYIRIRQTIDYELEIERYEHNLCRNDTRCAYFSNGRVFTAWVDFDSSSRTLEVRVANGSNPSVKKPPQPLLFIPNFRIPHLLGDDVYLTFWGSADVNHVEAHELLSWSFFSSEISDRIIPSSQTLLQIWKARAWAGISTGVLGMVAAAAAVILWSISRYSNLSRYYRYKALRHTAGPHEFSYAELRKATENFDERTLLGSGGSGSVYRGSLEGPEGVHFVAVKQINFSETKQAESVFHAEVSSLGQIRHRNVVQLLGWCREKGRLLLVYDYMPNGGLNEWLHTSRSHDLERQQVVLSLRMRQSILEGVGAALEYLHEDCLSCILHRDIKSSNVLLDEDFNAHLGDFGLARLMDHHKLDKTTLAAGTLGYMAPEIPYTGKASKESDVYSFGMLVLEVVCARRPLDLQAMEPEDLVLLHSVWRAYEAGLLLSVVDPRLLQTLEPSRSVPLQDDEITHAIRPPISPEYHNLTDSNAPNSTVVDVDVEVCRAMIVNLLRLGLLCCLPNPRARPSLGQVNGILQQIRDMENETVITTIAMPFLPTTKPLGLYHSLEFSQTILSSTSAVPAYMSSMSSSHAKSSLDKCTMEQGFDNLRKDD